jgi:hypothetical protein
MRMGIGIGWPNASAPTAPTVYAYEINTCSGVEGTVYSSSSVFEAGITIYLNSELTEPVESTTFDDPFNKFPDEPFPGYKCNDVGLVSISSKTCL